MHARILLLLLALTLVGCQTGVATEGGAGFIAGAGTVDLDPHERSPAPAVQGVTLEGDPLALSDLDGIVVVNFWASWCGPCAAEAPDLVATHDRYADRGVSLLGVNVRDSQTNARSFERDHAKPYPSLFDEDQSIAAQFGGIGAAALPTTVLIDTDGNVAARLFGQVTADALAARLDALLAEADRQDEP